jgi:hypothetical protein
MTKRLIVEVLLPDDDDDRIQTAFGMESLQAARYQWSRLVARGTIDHVKVTNVREPKPKAKMATKRVVKKMEQESA